METYTCKTLSFQFPTPSHEKGEKNMKTKIIQLLHLLGLDALLLGLLEKLLLKSIKKLTDWTSSLRRFLDRAQKLRNEILPPH